MNIDNIELTAVESEHRVLEFRSREAIDYNDVDMTALKRANLPPVANPDDWGLLIELPDGRVLTEDEELDRYTAEKAGDAQSDKLDELQKAVDEVSIPAEEIVEEIEAEMDEDKKSKADETMEMVEDFHSPADRAVESADDSPEPITAKEMFMHQLDELHDPSIYGRFVGEPDEWPEPQTPDGMFDYIDSFEGKMHQYPEGGSTVEYAPKDMTIRIAGAEFEVADVKMEITHGPYTEAELTMTEVDNGDAE